MDILELFSKPADYQFSPEEIDFIKKKTPKSSFKAKYALYKPQSSKGLYIGFVIDSMPYCPRRSGFENHWEFVCQRDLTNIEYQEVIENFGTNKRRFKVWMYDVIERLQADDKKYYLETPEEFVKLCKDKGYTGDMQLVMQFETYEED